jgi:valyl-tRNA synthetase
MGSGFPAFGADAVRFTLTTYPPSNKRIALAPKRIEGNRHFLNKIWNATRLSVELLGDYEAGPAGLAESQDVTPAGGPALYNRWIRSRFAAACEAAHAGLDTFRIDESANASYRFFWNELCDWYLELIKPVLREPSRSLAERDQTRATLAYVLEGALRLMHPLMPFITEELWHRVPRPASRGPTIALAPYPAPETEGAARDVRVEATMDLVKAWITEARTIRSEHDVDKKAEVLMTLRTDSSYVAQVATANASAIAHLVKTKGDPQVLPFSAPRQGGTAVAAVPTQDGPSEPGIQLKGLVDPGAERARIARELKKIERDLTAIEKKLAGRGFVDRAPRDVVEETRSQHRALVEARTRLEAATAFVGELEGDNGVGDG